jgi:hypothetical protein
LPVLASIKIQAFAARLGGAGINILLCIDDAKVVKKSKGQMMVSIVFRIVLDHFIS